MDAVVDGFARRGVEPTGITPHDAIFCRAVGASPVRQGSFEDSYLLIGIAWVVDELAPIDLRGGGNEVIILFVNVINCLSVRL